MMSYALKNASNNFTSKINCLLTCGPTGPGGPGGPCGIGGSVVTASVGKVTPGKQFTLL